MIPLFKVYMNPIVNESLLKVLHSGWVGQCSKTDEFEKALSKRVDNPRCLSLSAGTHGIHLALRLLNIRSNDEVISTPLTCTATNMPILMQGADIVWADINPTDLNIDPLSIKEKITRNTKAIIAVHWGGYPCDMADIYEIAKEHNIAVIEDAAHAFGATLYNTRIGDCRYSDFVMFSFQAIKHLTCVDGGALLFKDDNYYKRGKLLRWYGIDREGTRKDLRCEEDIKEYGYKYHMNDVNATIGLSNLQKVDGLISTGKQNAAYYNSELAGISGIELLQKNPQKESSYWLYTILVEDRSGFSRLMGEEGIMVSRVHERNDKHTCFRKYKEQLPNLESVTHKMICIPVGWWVSKEDREYIVNTIKKGW